MWKTYATWLAAACAVMITSYGEANASISVDKAEVVVDGETRRETITVANNRATPAFVEISAREILNPGEQPEQANRGPDPSGVGLLAGPTRFSVLIEGFSPFGRATASTFNNVSTLTGLVSNRVSETCATGDRVALTVFRFEPVAVTQRNGAYNGVVSIIMAVE